MVSEESVASSGNEMIHLFPNVQVSKRPVESPLSELAEKKPWVKQDLGGSLVEDLDRLWPVDSPSEVSFLHIELRTLAPRVPQESCSVGPEAGDTGHPPDPRTVGIKEEQVSQF